MPFLQSSGAISINNIKTLFGGPESPAMSNYYRGGAYIPSTKTINFTVREPTTGESYVGPSTTVWLVDQIDGSGIIRISWAGTVVYNAVNTGVTSVTVSGITYFRGTLRATSNVAKNRTQYFYALYRTYPSSSQQAINTGIPSSGTISLNQFYGAEKP